MSLTDNTPANVHAEAEEKRVYLPPTAALYEPVTLGAWCAANRQPYVEFGGDGDLLLPLNTMASAKKSGAKSAMQVRRAPMFAGLTPDVAILPPVGFVCTADKSLIYEGLGHRDYKPWEDFPRFYLGVDPELRFGIDLINADLFTVGEECVYLGGDTNFGHFLFQYLLKLSTFAWLPDLQAMPLAVCENLPKRYLDFLELCGFPSERRIPIPATVPTRFTKVWSISTPLRRGPAGEVRVWAEGIWGIRYQFAHLMRPLNGKRPRLFIPRSTANWRRLVNEGEVLQTIGGFDIAPIEFSTMPAAEQIAAISNAELIVCVQGAASEMTMFAPPDCAIVELAVPGLGGAMGPVTFAAVMGQPFVRITGRKVEAEESLALGLPPSASKKKIDFDFAIDCVELDRILTEADRQCREAASARIGRSTQQPHG